MHRASREGWLALGREVNMNIAQTIPLTDTWGMHGDVGTGWMVAMMIGMVLFWAVVILGIVWLVRDGIGRSQRPREETPLAILDRRFAEGALSLDDYRERRDVLTGATAPRPHPGVSSRESERS